MQEVQVDLVSEQGNCGDERMVVIYLENSIVRISSYSTEEGDIKSSQFSTGIESNLITTENKS